MWDKLDLLINNSSYRLITLIEAQTIFFFSENYQDVSKILQAFNGMTKSINGKILIKSHYLCE